MFNGDIAEGSIEHREVIKSTKSREDRLIHSHSDRNSTNLSPQAAENKEHKMETKQANSGKSAI